MLGKLSFKTIYRWIYRWIYGGRIDGVTMLNLRRKGKKRTCKNLVLYSKGTSIRKRPKEVYSRKTFGNWELDTIVSGKTKGGCFATFNEQDLNHSLMLINNRPRKCLGWISPAQAFEIEVSQLGWRGGE